MIRLSKGKSGGSLSSGEPHREPWTGSLARCEVIEDYAIGR